MIKSGEIYNDYYDARTIFYSACDGLVENKNDAQKAVIFYTVFYNKLKYEDKLNDEIRKAFKRTIEKYGNWEAEYGKIRKISNI